MEDGLYLKDTWVSSIDCALTYQGNDLTQPDTRTASFSNTFQLPDSLAIRDLLESAEQLDAGGPYPYRQVPAKLIDQGEVIFSGFAELVSFSAGWKVNLFESVLSFFDSLKDKKLTDLDLSRLDHPWTLDYINKVNSNAATSTNTFPEIAYPLIDYGGLSGNEQPYDTLFPSVYLKTIIGQICKETGYIPVGEWLTDPLLQRMYLPFVEGTPKAHDEDWVADRSAWITTNGTTTSIHLEDGHPVDVILPLSVDNDSFNGYKQGKIRPYNVNRYTYVCPDNMRLKVTASINFVSIVKFGAADLRLELWKNSEKVAEDYYSKGGYYDGLDISESLQIDESIDCLKSDQLFLKLTGSSRTNLSDYSYYFSLANGDCYASFVPDSSLHFGETWFVSPNLPSDLSCSDVMLTLAKLTCGTFITDEKKKTVELTLFDGVIKQIPNAKDYSSKVDESIEPELNVQIDPYGKRNYLKWKEQSNKSDIGYGDGFIPCDVANTGDVDLFELPFMACLNSDQNVSGYGSPVLIKTRTITGTAGNISINDEATAARIILVEPSKVVSLQTQQLSPDGDVTKVHITLTGCWWHSKPNGLATDSTTRFGLSFGPISSLAGNSLEQPLIDRYFNGLKRVLRRPRQLTANFYLDAYDIATLSLGVPVLLQQVRLGSLDINYTYFYINKLSNYRSSVPCSIALIAI